MKFDPKQELTDDDRMRLIHLLLHDLEHGDGLFEVLAIYYQDLASVYGASYQRMADFLMQFEHCEGPFERYDDDDCELRPGKWVHD